MELFKQFNGLITFKLSFLDIETSELNLPEYSSPPPPCVTSECSLRSVL